MTDWCYKYGGCVLTSGWRMRTIMWRYMRSWPTEAAKASSRQCSISWRSGLNEQTQPVSSTNGWRCGPTSSLPCHRWPETVSFSAPSPHSSLLTQAVEAWRCGLPAQTSDERSFLSATSSILSGLDDSARQRRFSLAVSSLRETRPLKKKVPMLKDRVRCDTFRGTWAGLDKTRWKSALSTFNVSVKLWWNNDEWYNQNQFYVSSVFPL